MYIKEFADAKIIDARLIVDINSNLKSYDEIETEYNSIAVSWQFQIIAVSYLAYYCMPHHWQLNSVFNNQRNELIENILQNLQT